MENFGRVRRSALIDDVPTFPAQPQAVCDVLTLLWRLARIISRSIARRGTYVSGMAGFQTLLRIRMWPGCQFSTVRIRAEVRRSFCKDTFCAR